mmetsp:Transcript_124985/g.312391  ORF Transcript_124985/g.312391 Transcript_124985/m.312391 type:complete len:209 (-) Transcript_124985:632-1258(-)
MLPWRRRAPCGSDCWQALLASPDNCCLHQSAPGFPLLEPHARATERPLGSPLVRRVAGAGEPPLVTTKRQFQHTRPAMAIGMLCHQRRVWHLHWHGCQVHQLLQPIGSLCHASHSQAQHVDLRPTLSPNRLKRMLPRGPHLAQHSAQPVHQAGHNPPGRQQQRGTPKHRRFPLRHPGLEGLTQPKCRCSYWMWQVFCGGRQLPEACQA